MIIITAIVDDYEFTIYVPKEDSKKILDFLDRNGIRYQTREV